MNNDNLEITYKFAHIGINSADENEAKKTVDMLKKLFNFRFFDVGNSIIVEGPIEVVKSVGRGGNGHIGIETNNVELAIVDLEKKGISSDMTTTNYNENNELLSVYLDLEISGFVFHLLKSR